MKRVGVIGLGYVGVPLANLLSSKYDTIGFDVDEGRVGMINRGLSYIEEISDITFSATTNMSELGEMDVIVICVPTPIKDSNPDATALNSAIEAIRLYGLAGALVILESTVSPGTTRAMSSILSDFHVAFSPERIDPGSHIPLHTIPKIIGGMDPSDTEMTCEFYGEVFDTIIPVKSPETAEVGKLLENIYRFVNISLVNELFVNQDCLGVSMREVVNSLVEAATPACGYAPFYPGVGVGGHCIAVDPIYMQDFLVKHDRLSTLIDDARVINDLMPWHHTMKIERLVNKPNARIMVLGLTYKPNVGDFRESRSMDLLVELKKRDHLVTYHDPYLSGSKPLSTIDQNDIVVVATKHSIYDLDDIRRRAKLYYDCQIG